LRLRDLAIEIDATTFYALIVLLVITMSTVSKQGGVKIVSWRIRGKRGFLITMIEPDKKAFKDALAKGTFYKDLRAKFGEESWKLLQDSVGSLG